MKLFPGDTTKLQVLTNCILVHTQLKITSRLQKMAQSYVQTLLLKLMIRQIPVTIWISDMTLVQLHLKTWVILPIEKTLPFTLKSCHMEVNKTHDLTVSKTYVWEVTKIWLLQSALRSSNFSSSCHFFSFLTSRLFREATMNNHIGAAFSRLKSNENTIYNNQF